MMTGWSALLFAVSALCVSGVVIDKPSTYPSDWIKLRPSNPHQEIELIFAIKQQNVDLLTRRLLEISTPYTEEYGNWMTKDEVYEMVAPSQDAIDSVTQWLLSFEHIKQDDIIPLTRNSDFIGVKTTAGYAGEILKCRYFDYMHISHHNDKDGKHKHFSKEKMIVPRMDTDCDYHVPTFVSEYIDFVSPTKRFPVIKKLIVSPAKDVNAGEVTPAVLKALYNVGTAMGKSDKNSQGIASFVRQYYSQTSLEEFWKEYDIETDQVTKTDSADGNGDGLEALLDTQYITAMGELIPLQVWYNSGSFADAMLQWLLDLEKATDAPNLFSVSYGQPETNWGTSSVERLNVEFEKVTAQGITIFFASGDSGAGGGCTYDEKFEPEFPASSPWVTSVGGVHGGDAGHTPLGEEVWIDGGGGFSDIASIQSWQSTAVADYFETAKNSLPDASQWNKTGRGYPDMAAQSVDFVIVENGENVGVSGTSCASPTAAGIFALLNDLRLQNNMAVLGFANPLIYELATSDSSVFNDCTEGYNKGCSNTQRGFTAVTGWDAASGWGSPDYGVLATKILETGEITKKWVKKDSDMQK